MNKSDVSTHYHTDTDMTLSLFRFQTYIVQGISLHDEVTIDRMKDRISVSYWCFLPPTKTNLDPHRSIEAFRHPKPFVSCFSLPTPLRPRGLVLKLPNCDVGLSPSLVGRCHHLLGQSLLLCLRTIDSGQMTNCVVTRRPPLS